MRVIGGKVPLELGSVLLPLEEVASVTLLHSYLREELRLGTVMAE